MQQSSLFLFKDATATGYEDCVVVPEMELKGLLDDITRLTKQSTAGRHLFEDI